MTDRQPELQSILENLESSEAFKVYFQPPVTLEMTYPCIRYEREPGYTTFAGNKPYFHVRRYSLKLITRKPDQDLYDQLVNLPMCTHQRYYPADKLHHDVFTIYF